jgi:DNA-directed RNA polymerase
MYAIDDWKKSIEMKKKYLCQNPILFDATCNGIQHLSALTREMDLAIKVNLSIDKNKIDQSIINDKPQDFYNYAVELLHNEFKELPLLTEYDNIRKIKLDRSLIKRTVMTIPYNISLTGVGEQLNEYFKFVKEGKKTFVVVNEEYTYDETKLFLTPREYGLLTKIIYKVLTQKMPSLKALTDYLNDLVKVLLRLNKPVV